MKIALGALIYRFARLGDDFWTGLERLVYFVFFPVGAYTGGSLALIDDQTGEADDYDVNFAIS